MKRNFTQKRTTFVQQLILLIYHFKLGAIMYAKSKKSTEEVSYIDYIFSTEVPFVIHRDYGIFQRQKIFQQWKTKAAWLTITRQLNLHINNLLVDVDKIIQDYVL